MQTHGQDGDKKKYDRLIGDTIIFAIGNLGSKIILFFMVPLYTHFLSKEEYGTSDLIFTVAQLVVPFVSLVIFDALLRFGLAKSADKQTVLKNSFIVVFFGGIVTIMVTPLCTFYAPLTEWRWYLCSYVILTMICNVELNYLKVIGKNRAFAAISVLHTVVLATSNVILLAVMHLGIRGYLLAAIFGSITTAVLATIHGDVIPALYTGKYDKELLVKMTMYSSPLILNNVSWWVIQSSDKIMIEAMVDAGALGLYTAATKIPSLINVIISIFSQAWGISSVYEYESTNDNSFYSDVFIAYSAIGFGAAIGINTIVKPFMTHYVSSAFIESWRYVPLLLASASFSAIASYYGSLYGALKKSVNNMRSTLVAAIINIIVNYIFIIKLGTWGAIIGTITAYIVLALYRMIDVLRYIKFNPRWEIFLFNSAIVVLQAILVSLDYYRGLVSGIALFAYLLVNRYTIKKILLVSWGLINRRR